MLKLSEGSVVALDSQATAPVDVYVAGTLVARGTTNIRRKVLRPGHRSAIRGSQISRRLNPSDPAESIERKCANSLKESCLWDPSTAQLGAALALLLSVVIGPTRMTFAEDAPAQVRGPNTAGRQLIERATYVEPARLSKADSDPPRPLPPVKRDSLSEKSDTPRAPGAI